ncbi:MAG: xanthine dehydrogenase accessory protein XdhC [Pseudomonadota bacterium]
MYKRRHDINQFTKTAGQLVIVEIDTVHGSTPREEGAWMLVGRDQIYRTIGGGQLENMAIEKAREILTLGSADPLELQIPLGPHIGQCCGGTVRLKISLLDDLALQVRVGLIQEELTQLPRVLIFGAGHVGNALSEALSLMPVHPVLIDTRETELASSPDGVETCLTAMPEMQVREANPGSAFVILTHDHSLDFLIAIEALSRRDAAYVGMIGSKTKRATFRNWLRRENGSDAGIENLICPIGDPTVKDKRPEVIAALASAEVMTHLHYYTTKRSGSDQQPKLQRISRG